jgi:hypothetical protein
MGRIIWRVFLFAVACIVTMLVATALLQLSGIANPMPYPALIGTAAGLFVWWVTGRPAKSAATANKGWNWDRLKPD